MKRILHEVAILLLSATSLWAAHPFEAWIETALDNNQEILAGRKKWEAVAARAGQLGAIADPMVGADFERADSTKFNDYNDIEYMVSQDLPGFGKRKSNSSAARLEAEAEGFRYLELTRKVRSEVIKAGWTIWERQREVEIGRDVLSLMEQMETSALARYESGKGMQADVLRFQVEVARMSNDLVTMQNELGVTQASLNSLLNEPPETERRVKSLPPLPAIARTLAEYQAKAKKFNCILLSFAREIEAKRMALGAARKEGRPDVQFRVEARQFEGRGGINEYDTGVFFNFPWLWRGKYRAMAAEAQADLNMAEAELQQETNMTLFEIQELYTMAEADQRTVKLHETVLLPRAQQLVDTSREGYQAGQVTALELLEALRMLQDTELGHAKSMASFGNNFAALDRIAARWGPRDFATGLVTPDMND